MVFNWEAKRIVANSRKEVVVVKPTESHRLTLSAGVQLVGQIAVGAVVPSAGFFAPGWRPLGLV
jgi:hypothetical protein